MTTREEFQAQLRSLADMLEPPPPPPPPPGPSFNTKTVTIHVHDVVVRHDETVARVPVMLSEPSSQTLLFRILTKNDTAREGAHFQRVDQWLAFHPGEQAKIIEIPLNASIAGLQFKIDAIQVQGWDGTAAPDFTDSSATIYGYGAQPVPTPIVEAPSVGLTKRPSGLTLVWEDRFSPLEFAATDSGFKLDNITPCWRSRMGFGRMWTNGTIAPAVDPVLHPNTQPWGWENDRFYLQSEHKLVSYEGQSFDWTMPMITTQKIPDANNIGVGDYVEVRATLPAQVGAWPAIWLLTNKSGAWPLLEFDLMEGFFSGAANLTKIGTTVHWKTETGGHGQYGVRIPHTGIDILQPHTWGMWWGPKLIVFYVDDVPYMAVPNIWDHSERAYLKLNIAVGGQGGTPDPLNWPVKMPIEWVKLWR